MYVLANIEKALDEQINNRCDTREKNKLTIRMLVSYPSPAMVMFVVNVNELTLCYYFHPVSFLRYYLLSDVVFWWCYAEWHYSVGLVLEQIDHQVCEIKK